MHQRFSPWSRFSRNSLSQYVFNYECMHDDKVLQRGLMSVQDISTILCCAPHIGYWFLVTTVWNTPRNSRGSFLVFISMIWFNKMSQSSLTQVISIIVSLRPLLASLCKSACRMPHAALITQSSLHWAHRSNGVLPFLSLVNNRSRACAASSHANSPQQNDHMASQKKSEIQ